MFDPGHWLLEQCLTLLLGLWSSNRLYSDLGIVRHLPDWLCTCKEHPDFSHLQIFGWNIWFTSIDCCCWNHDRYLETFVAPSIPDLTEREAKVNPNTKETASK